MRGYFWYRASVFVHVRKERKRIASFRGVFGKLFPFRSNIKSLAVFGGSTGISCSSPSIGLYDPIILQELQQLLQEWEAG